MLCPSCGPNGSLEQVEFSSTRELLYCKRCKVTYVVYPVRPGEYTEPVPLHKEARAEQSHQE